MIIPTWNPQVITGFHLSNQMCLLKSISKLKLIFSFGVSTDSPCHLYLDLEFDRIRNPGRNGENMVAIYLQVGSFGYFWMNEMNEL